MEAEEGSTHLPFRKLPPVSLSSSVRSISVSIRQKVHLTDPKTHSSEEILRLLDEYRQAYPDIIADWIRIERSDNWSGDPLADINRHGIQFLMDHTRWDSLTALSKAWFDWRGKVRTWALAQ
jgi:hypothetical protein